MNKENEQLMQEYLPLIESHLGSIAKSLRLLALLEYDEGRELRPRSYYTEMMRQRLEGEIAAHCARD